MRSEPALLLPRIAACCWLLTLSSFTLNAGWHVRAPVGSGAVYHLFVFDLPMLATIASWAIGLVLGAAPVPRLGPRIPAGALTGLAVLATIGVPAATVPGVALGMAIRLWLALAFYLYTVSHFHDLRWVASSLCLGLAAQGAVAVGQIVRQRSLGLGWLGERVIDPAAHGIAVVDVHGHRWLRPYALTLHPNLLGGIAACCLVLLAASLPRRQAIVATGACTVLLGLTLSRGAWVAGLTAGTLYLLWVKQLISVPRRLGWTAVLFGALATAFLLITPAGTLIISRFDPANPLEQQSIGARLTEYGEAWQLFTTHPLLGVGANCYLAAIGPLLPAAIARDGQTPVVHNAYVLAATEVGIVGPFLLALALLVPAWHIQRTQDRATVALASAIAACAVLGLFDFYAWSSASFRFLWVTMLALWAARVRTNTSGNVVSPPAAACRSHPLAETR
jgi:O-antigen ligase